MHHVNHAWSLPDPKFDAPYILGVRQWRHVVLRRRAFCVSRQHRLCSWWLGHFMYYSWKAHVFIHLWNNVYNRWITSNFPFRWHRTASTTSGLKSSIFNRNSSGERRLKFIASGEDDDNKPRAKYREHRLSQRRQRRQHSDREHVQRQQQKTTIILQMEPMKGGNTDCRRFKKRWGDQATLTVYSKIIFFDATISSNSYTICIMHVKNIFPTDWGQPISLYTMSNIGFYSKLYFTMNSL